MQRSCMTRMPVASALFLALASILLVACGGGGGGDNVGGGSSAVLNTSFQGFPSVPGGGLPPVIRDEVLEFTMAGPIDDGIFGGFFVDMGQTDPTEFQGGRLINGTTLAVPYFAYVDQTAARNALQIRDDAGTVAGPWPGIVGRHATKANTLIFDPNVTTGLEALFGVTMSQGFDQDTQYDVFIPANSGITVAGQPVPTFGSLPPVGVPGFTISPGVSTIFRTGAGFLDRPAPAVAQITSANTELIGGTPGVDDIPFDDTIIVRFTESVDLATIDLQNNLIIRNTDLANSQQPNGVLVPVNFTIDSALRELRFTPQPSFGSGPFNIVVQVVKFDESDPVQDALNIKGLPSGATATQKALQGNIGVVAQVNFTTISQPGEPNPVTIIENFDDNGQRDPGYSAPFNPAAWAENMSGALIGLQTDGEPLQTNLGTGPGARVQFTFQPTGTANPGNPNCTTPLCTYSSPFDDNQINNGLNPNGGSRVQHLYVTNGTELPNNSPDSIELVEWSTPNMVASMVTYNGYSMEIGHTGNNITGAATLTTIYPANFDFDNPQNSRWIKPTMHPDPNNTIANEAPVLCFGPAPYTVSQLAGTFIPFPRLTVPFDFDDTVNGPNSIGQSVSPQIIIEHEVPSPHITMNNLVNVVIGTNETMPTPFRRAIGSPGVDNAIALDAVRYHTRMTVAKKNSSARSRFYNSGATGGSMVNYNSIQVTPALSARPANTRIELALQSATDANGSGAQSFDNAVYYDLNGNLNLGALNSISGTNRAFFRYRVRFESDLLTNTPPQIDGMIFGITF